MKHVPEKLPVIAFWGLALAQMALAGSSEQYFVQGRQVSRQVYEAGVLLSQGTTLMRSNRNQEAMEKLRQSVALAPELPEAHHNLALALGKLGRITEAAQELKTALTLDPNLDMSWLSLGGLYQSSGQMTDAIAAYEEFINRFPRHKDAGKITSLIEGLKKESQRQGEARTQGTTGRELDYYGEVTVSGVIKWPASRMPIRVHIADSSAVPGYKPQFDAILMRSFQDWATVSQGLITFKFVDDAAEADLECTWINNPSLLANSAEAGETRLFKDKKGIVKATLKLLTVPMLRELPMTDFRVRTITLHEIGHALGVAGHSSNPDDVMYFSATVAEKWRDLTARDARTIVRLYSSTDKTP